MTFSTVNFKDGYHEIKERLFIPSSMECEFLRMVDDASYIDFDIPEGTELYSVWETDMFEASYSYAIYKYNWDSEDWDQIDSNLTFIYERKSRIEECLAEAEQALRDKGMILVC